MPSLYLSDILKRNGLDIKRVKLIRHSLNHDLFAKCYLDGFTEEYQKIQKPNFFKNCDYILTFISEPGTSAKFHGCYEVGVSTPAEKHLMKKGFPSPEMFDGKYHYFDLKESSTLSDLKNRLIIDWGKSTMSWHQWATNDKEVLVIQENPKLSFCGFENVFLSYYDLKEIVEDRVLYENWHTALESIYAIYIIVDVSNGKQYVGSAYGEGGLLKRWKCYINTKHGGNVRMIKLINEDPERYKFFQFSILQILPKTVREDDVIKIENLYKKKLQSREFGMNEN
ncbi:GIY-YIG nuclease family protein [Alkaliphilus serpentinus]|uniref:GIY-YIG nuclease family protein n=1 Tax=Alkaliphilus serpentinus TaxID=1482731 RepID=A0A833M6Y4_9FIRM|nr:GIY-YIG nuclease family protein [Alkaliphilus serpentinus]KAB3525728.1 GIY-YIG nuclease family protein [Alkaliphilus serpentinus]